MGREFGEDIRDVLAEDLLVGAGGEEGFIVVVSRKDGFDHGGEKPEGVFGGGHDEQEGGGDEVHALAVSDFGVAAGVGEEDFVEFGDAGAFAEEDVIGEGAGDVHLDLEGDGGIVGAVGDEVVVVAWDAEGGGAGAFGPDFGTEGDWDAGEDELF